MTHRTVEAGIACALAVAAVLPAAAQPDRLFEFRIAFWNSLHHHWHASARPRPVAPLEIPADAPDAEALRSGWTRALEFYRPLGPRSLLFDEGLAAFSRALSDARNAPTLSGTAVSAAAREALEAAAPAYRALVWPAHERDGRAFAADARPLVDRHGPALCAPSIAPPGTATSSSVATSGTP